jgi:NodT family efflux transporter outer membrane factor (OMF) lipoprotein
MRVVIPFSLLIFGLCSCANMGQNQVGVKPVKGIDISGVKSETVGDRSLFVCGDWPEKNWWDDFQDPDLSLAIEQGLKESPSLQSVEARVLAAKAQSDVVKSKLFPQINALFNLIWIYLSKGVHKKFPSIDQNFHFYTAGLDFNYELDFWGKNKKLFLASLGDVKTEEALYQQAKIVLSTSIAVGYYNLQASAVKIRVVSEILECRAKLLAMSELLDVHQIGNGIDVNQRARDLLVLQESLAALKEELALHKSSFKTLLGQNPSSDLDFGFAWNVRFAPLEIPNEIGLNLLARRADLAAQMARVRKSSELVGVAVSQFFPSVNLAGLLAFQDLDINKLCTPQSFMPTLIPLVQLPIFHGGKLRANLREKIAMHESIVLEYNDLILKAANEVVKGISRLRSVNERLGYQTDKVAVVKVVSDLTAIKFNQGIDSLYKALQTKEELLWAELHQVELQRLKYDAIIRLIKALGGGYGSE